MKKYVVKETSIATNDNPNFAGDVIVTLSGKWQKTISHKSTGKSKDCDFDLGEYGIKEYGYDRECDAKKSWVYKNPENTKYWTSTVEIVCVEI